MPTSVLAVSHMGYLTGAPEKRAYLVNPGPEKGVRRSLYGDHVSQR